MKKTVLILVALIMSFGAFAQRVDLSEGFEGEVLFEALKWNPLLPPPPWDPEGTNGAPDITLNDPLAWVLKNNQEGVEVSSEKAKTGEFSLKVTTKSDSKNAWDTQFTTPRLNLIPGDTYTLSFWACSTGGDGWARISTEGAAQIGPPAGGTGPAPDQYWYGFTITPVWKEFTNFSYPNNEGVQGSNVLVTYEAEESWLNFDMGETPNMTYFLDDFEIINLDQDPGAIKEVKLTAKDIAFGVAGGIVVKGQQADVYSIDGRLVKKATYGFNALSAGVYVVKSQGVAAKFVVK